jgi:putative aldouronate transport system substrate-binding protein
MKRKKLTGMLLASSVALTIIPACSVKDAAKQPEATKEIVKNVNATGFPIAKEPIKLKFAAGLAPGNNPNWNDVKIFNEYEKKTNMDIEWTMIPFDALTEKKNLMLSSGDYPDAFHTGRFTAAEMLRYGQQGVLIKLNDLIDKYAPNFKAIMDKYPQVKKGITMPDGNIYSLPTFYDPEFESVINAAKMWIKQSWLDKLGMKEPTTTEEFYQYLKAVKEKDPNGNGKPDEIGYADVTLNNLIYYLRGSWGLGNHGISHRYVDTDPKTNKLRFIQADPNYKEMLQYVNKLYTEGLINPNVYTVKSPEYIAKGTEGVYGSAIATNMNTSMKQTDYIGATALKGPHGDQIFSLTKSPIVWIGAFAITDKNKEPEATMRWIDYFYGDEGVKNFFMGFEGVTYKTNPDGSLDYTDEMAKNPKGLTLEQSLAQNLTWIGGSYPSIVKQKFFKGAEAMPESLEATKKIHPYLPKDVWPTFNYTEKETEKMSTTGTDLQNYVNEMEAKFITGKESFDNWDKYLDTLKKMGLDDYMKIYNDAYERFKKD